MINSKDTYKIFASFYDAYAGRFSDDLEFYSAYCGRTDRIIEIGCGTGRILEFFLKLRYTIDGADISREMLHKAEEKLAQWISTGKLNLFLHDFTTGKTESGYDRALVSFYTFNYIIHKPAEFLRNIFESLNEKGLLLMDLFYPDTLLDKSINNKWIEKECETDGTIIKIKDKRHIADNTERRQQIFLINGDQIKIDTDRKYYSPEAVRSLLKEAGFSEIELAPDYNTNEFSEMIDESRLRNNFIVKAKI
ncbi:MAG: class I SAM-dependent methyltransferase [Spirochaetes bacterium]|nr:class I SAM-dependent methyltransferase [Spirochaetota bacterium]